jgi:hypothetical protein
VSDRAMEQWVWLEQWSNGAMEQWIYCMNLNARKLFDQ